MRHQNKRAHECTICHIRNICPTTERGAEWCSKWHTHWAFGRGTQERTQWQHSIGQPGPEPAWFPRRFRAMQSHTVCKHNPGHWRQKTRDNLRTLFGHDKAQFTRQQWPPYELLVGARCIRTPKHTTEHTTSPKQMKRELPVGSITPKTKTTLYHHCDIVGKVPVHWNILAHFETHTKQTSCQQSIQALCAQ